MRSLTLALGAAVLLSAAPAHATIVEKLSVAQMAQRADRVVHGVVRNQYTTWSDDRSRILTYAEVEVRSNLKGESGPVVVVTNAGSIDGLNDFPSGTPRLKDGDEVVLFLEKHPVVPGAFVHLAMSSTVFRVQRTGKEARVTRSVAGLGFAIVDANGPMRLEEPSAERESFGRLEDFLARVRQAVTAGVTR